MLSIPMVAIKSPIKPPITPFSTDSEETELIIEIPKSANAKYSGFEKDVATRASCGASNISMTALKIPPNILANVDSPKALPGCGGSFGPL